MTVIATIITAHCTAHATDSFLTQRRRDGSCSILENQQTKIVRVPSFRGALAYWGLARHGKWDILRWLQEQANQATRYTSPEEFAVGLGQCLQAELNRRRFASPIEKGIGIHFTAYEHIAGYWIPELFLISNFADTNYASLRPEGVGVTRETYGTLKGISERTADHGEEGKRIAVHQAVLNNRIMFIFNNGDPVLFNPIANSVHQTISCLLQRKQMCESLNAPKCLSLVRRPVELVSRLLSDLAEPGSRLIGGKPHDLAISPDGSFISTTGD